MKTPELEQFCSALASLYESELVAPSGEVDTDWWHAFNKDIDVNLWSDGKYLFVSAYWYTDDDGLNTTNHINIIHKHLKTNA